MSETVVCIVGEGSKILDVLNSILVAIVTNCMLGRNELGKLDIELRVISDVLDPGCDRLNNEELCLDGIVVNLTSDTLGLISAMLETSFVDWFLTSDILGVTSDLCITSAVLVTKDNVLNGTDILGVTIDDVSMISLVIPI